MHYGTQQAAAAHPCLAHKWLFAALIPAPGVVCCILCVRVCVRVRVRMRVRVRVRVRVCVFSEREREIEIGKWAITIYGIHGHHVIL